MAFIYNLSGDESVKNEFIVPDYYKKFICKGSDCRTCCCAGWGVAIPMRQYFNLLGMPCKKKLREKLDRTFRPVGNPTPERYAEINHDHAGDCPLRMENGDCMLQSQCGEDALPSVCRIYPRGPRTDFAYECSCSNSCEKTLELLFENDEPIVFGKTELAFKIPKQEHKDAFEDPTFYPRVRAFCLGILENRSYPLSTRILMIGKVLSALDADRQVDLEAIVLTVPPYARDVPATYGVLFNIGRWFIENGRSIAAFCLDNEAFYQDGDLQAKYDAALGHFEEVLPDHEIRFEKMLVNDLFFRQFPFREDAANFTDEFIGLCGTYLFARYLAISLMRDRYGRTDFVDIMAKTFRVISHTRFERNITILLKDENAAGFDTLATLLQA